MDVKSRTRTEVSPDSVLTSPLNLSKSCNFSELNFLACEMRRLNEIISGPFLAPRFSEEQIH